MTSDSRRFNILITRLSNLGIDGFIIALFMAIALAYVWPQGGTGKGIFSLSQLANHGVSIIFFFYGLKLDTHSLRQDLKNWKLHLLLQTSTFILFPLIILPLRPLFLDETWKLLWLGMYFVASLPSTVSSSVVMVSIAEGNIPAAIFNASLSSLLGIIITPVWMAMVTTPVAGSLPLDDIFLKLVLQVLVPVILGMVLHSRAGAWANRYKKQLRYFDQTVILIIVYTAFCDSFEKKLFTTLGWGDITLLSLLMTGLFFTVYFLVNMVSDWLTFSREDKITASFCGSKKSLVHGTVMSQVLFPKSLPTGILLLPLMIYHASQLIIVSVMARKMAKQKVNV